MWKKDAVGSEHANISFWITLIFPKWTKTIYFLDQKSQKIICLLIEHVISPELSWQNAYIYLLIYFYLGLSWFHLSKAQIQLPNSKGKRERECYIHNQMCHCRPLYQYRYSSNVTSLVDLYILSIVFSYKFLFYFFNVFINFLYF